MLVAVSRWVLPSVCLLCSVRRAQGLDLDEARVAAFEPRGYEALGMNLGRVDDLPCSAEALRHANRCFCTPCTDAPVPPRLPAKLRWCPPAFGTARHTLRDTRHAGDADSPC